MNPTRRTIALLACLLLLLPSFAEDLGPSLWSAEEKEAVEMSFIALAGCSIAKPELVADAVTGLMGEMLPDKEIVWGPALHMPSAADAILFGNLSDALVFVCRDRVSGVIEVVLRGTNTVSAAEWILQDFMIQEQAAWQDLVAYGLEPEAGVPERLSALIPAEALVSEGTATALRLRLNLVPEPGRPGEGTRLEDALVGLLEGAEGTCRMRFVGHSLGGLLAPVLATWLMDRLETTGRPELLARLEPEVLAFAGPTPGNPAFARHVEARLPGLARYVNDLDVAPRAWEESALAAMPELYLPAIQMQPVTKTLHAICLGIAREEEYAQPGAVINVPSRIVPARDGLYLLEAAWQHAVPYLEMLESGREGVILREVFQAMVDNLTLPGFKPIDLASLYSSLE